MLRALCKPPSESMRMRGELNLTSVLDEVKSKHLKRDAQRYQLVGLADNFQDLAQQVRELVKTVETTAVKAFARLFKSKTTMTPSLE